MLELVQRRLAAVGQMAGSALSPLPAPVSMFLHGVAIWLHGVVTRRAVS
jgi:hypothetical protein